MKWSRVTLAEGVSGPPCPLTRITIPHGNVTTIRTSVLRGVLELTRSRLRAMSVTTGTLADQGSNVPKRPVKKRGYDGKPLLVATDCW